MVTDAGIGAGTAASHSTSSHSRLGICRAIVGYTFGYTFDIGRQSEMEILAHEDYRIFRFATCKKDFISKY